MQGVEIHKGYFTVLYVLDRNAGQELHYEFETPSKVALEDMLLKESVPYYDDGDHESVTSGHIQNMSKILEYVYQIVYGTEGQKGSLVPTLYSALVGTGQNSPKF